MDKMNPKRIEEFAVNAVRNALLRTTHLAPYINQADKEPFWDGSIAIYKKESQTKDDYMGRVSTQVKGKEVAGIQKEEIKYSVKAVDLRGYLKDGGVIYFVVHLTKNGDEKRIYYNALTPVRLKNILSTLRGKQSKSLKFKQLFPLK